MTQILGLCVFALGLSVTIAAAYLESAFYPMALVAILAVIMLGQIDGK